MPPSKKSNNPNKTTIYLHIISHHKTTSDILVPNAPKQSSITTFYNPKEIKIAYSNSSDVMNILYTSISNYYNRNSRTISCQHVFLESRRK